MGKEGRNFLLDVASTSDKSGIWVDERHPLALHKVSFHHWLCIWLARRRGQTAARSSLVISHW